MIRFKPRAAAPAVLVAIAFCLSGPPAAHAQPIAEKGPAAAKSEEITEAPITDLDRTHWAFRPLVMPKLPPIDGQADANSDVANPVDRFLLPKLAGKGLRYAPPVPREVLLRRVCFDLTGLPPTLEQQTEFLADEAPDAFERLVDRLLASPAHGERAAQPWLDLARFAETDGFEHDKVRPQAWRYRDWVIEAMGSDLSYDQFLSLQLAGDELRSDEPAARVATGFCLSGPDMPDINSQQERRHSLLNELTSTVGSVFLALQIGCAQCHDHKYDPISQADFYRMRAFFDPSVRVRRNRSVSFLEPAQPTPSHLMIRGDWRRVGPPVAAAFPRIVATPNARANAADRVRETRGRRVALAKWLTRPDHPLTARVIVNRIWQQHFGKGLSRSPSDFGLMGDEPSHPELLDFLAVWLVRENWSIKRLRRLLVTSRAYRQRSRPPEQAHAGQTQKGQTQKGQTQQIAWKRRLEKDPENRLLSRFPRRRLSGEELRDALLTVSQTIVHHRGGPGVRPPLPPELVKTLLKNQWNVSPLRRDHYRRSIYVFARRNLRYPLFDAFDRPDANSSCARRNQSTTAQQSLWLLNSELASEMAARIAGRLLHHSASSGARLNVASRLFFGRSATDSEVRLLQDFLRRQEQLLQREGRAPENLRLPIPRPPSIPAARAAAWTDLCAALINSSAFLYID